MIFLVKYCNQIYLILILISGDMLRVFYFSVKNNILIYIIFRGFNT